MTGIAHNQVLKKIHSNPNQVNLLVITDLDAFLNTRQLVSQINYKKISDQGNNLSDLYSKPFRNFLKKFIFLIIRKEIEILITLEVKLLNF